MNITQLAKRMEKFAVDNSPAILTAIGVTGTLTTAYLSGKASFKAGQIIQEENRILQDRGKTFLDNKEKVKLVWKEYIPAASTATLTVTCIIGANRIGTRRAAALATAYSVSEKAFAEYKEKVVEKIGQKKEQAIRDEIAQDRVNNQPVVQREIIIAGSGDVLCYDKFTGRYFKSDMESLRRAENDVNYQVLNSMYATLSDYYERIGLPATSASEEVGWNCDKLLEVRYSTTLSDDGKPCIAIDFVVAPIRGYARLQ